MPTPAAAATSLIVADRRSTIRAPPLSARFDHLLMMTSPLETIP
jgi:hypothetical protein